MARSPARIASARRTVANLVALGVIGGGLRILGNLPNAVIGSAYSFTPTIQGGTAPYTVAVSGLAQGLSANASTGTVNGTPTGSAGTLSLTFTVTDSKGVTATMTRSLVIAASVASLTISGTPSGAVVGGADTFTPTVTGGMAPYTLSLASGTLPAGRTVNGSAGTVTGTYTTAGSYSYVLRATDAAGATADLAVSVTVSAAAAAVTVVPTVTVEDTFAGASGTVLETTSRPKSGWSKPIGGNADFMLDGEGFVGTTGATALSRNTVALGSGEYDIEATFKIKTTASGQTFIRVNGSAQNGIDFGLLNNAWVIQKAVSGTITTLATAPAFTGVAGKTYAVKIEVRPGTKRLFVDGVMVLETSDRDYPFPGSVYLRNADGSARTHIGALKITEYVRTAEAAPSGGWVSMFNFDAAPVLIQDKPAAMGVGYGPYGPALVDWRAYPSGDTARLYYSTDHDTGAGGIYMSACRGDPSVPANWKTYDQALAAGWYDSVSSKPAANPVFKLGSSNQVETPCIRRVGSEWIMTYQDKTPSGYRSQASRRARSSDGLTWTTDAGNLLTIPLERMAGDGHTGYAEFFPNPGFDLPYSYIAYSLAGGTDVGLCAQWGTNDPANGPYTLITPLARLGGRAIGANPDTSAFDWHWINGDSFRKVPGGFAAIMDIKSQASGNTLATSAIYEVVLDSKGQDMVRAPMLLQAATAGTQYAPLAGISTLMEYNGRNVLVFMGSDANHDNRLFVTSGPVRDANAVKHPPLVPARPSAVTERVFDFTGGAKPANVEEWTTGTASFGYDGAGGRTRTVQSAIATWFGSASIVPYDYDMVELFIEGWLTESAEANRQPTFGLGEQKSGSAGSQPNGLVVWGNDTAATFNMNRRRSGASGTSKANVVTPPYGLTSPAVPYAGSRKDVGLRWFPKDRRAFFLSYGRLEVQTWNVDPLDINPTIPLFPFFGIEGKAGAQTVERIERMTLRFG